VRDLMTPLEDVLTVRGDQTLAQLVDRIVFDRLSAYPVVDAGDRVVGTVTLGSLKGVDPAEREALTIGDVMGDAVTVSADDPAFEALQAFGESGDAPVVVTEDDRVVGVLTREDVARAMEVLQGLRTDSRPVVPDGYA
jgi:CBS domain containing-hemolysin-like protein